MIWYHCNIKKSILIIIKSDSTGLTKFSWQTNKLKLRKMLGDGQRTSLSYLQKSCLVRKITYLEKFLWLFLWRNLHWKSQPIMKYSSISKMKNWNNEKFKQNNADHVKGNRSKLEYKNYGKNMNASPSFIQKFLI